MKRILSVLFALFMTIGLFSACSSSEKADSAEKVQSESKVNSSSSEDDESISSASSDGEISQESFMELYDEYEAVAGKDSEKEEELLAKMQVFLESQESPAP